MAIIPAYSMHRDIKEATTTPVSSVGQLKGLWDRESGVFRMYVVQVVGRSGSVINFNFLDPVGGTVTSPGAGAAAYSIDLDDGRSAWGSLPSTAQLVTDFAGANVAYLGINEDWIIENVPDSSMVAGGPNEPPKIPRLYSL